MPVQIDRLDQLVLHSLTKELSLSQLSAVFSRRPLLRSLEKLVNAGRVVCRFDGRDYIYRAA